MSKEGDKDSVVTALFRLALFERRACYRIWLKYKINRNQFRTLLAMVAVLCIHDKKSLNRQQVLRYYTGHKDGKRKMGGYMQGLEERGYIKRIRLRNGQETYILRPVALTIIEDYGRIIAELEYKTMETERRRKEGKQLGKVDYSFRSRVPERLEDLRWIVSRLDDPSQLFSG